jgi:hypothetical protein
MRADFSLDYDVLTVEQPQQLYSLARMTSGPLRTTSSAVPEPLAGRRPQRRWPEKIDYTDRLLNSSSRISASATPLHRPLQRQNRNAARAEPVTNKDMICQRIGGKAGGTTNLSGGWLEGCTLVGEHPKDECLNRVILMTDGLANRGVTETDKLVAMAQQKRGERITTTTMGLGADFNEDLLMAMAEAGGGAFTSSKARK